MTGTDQVPKDDPKVAPRTVIEQLSLADELLDKNITVAPGQIDEKYRTTKREIWAYYVCVITKLIMKQYLIFTIAITSETMDCPYSVSYKYQALSIPSFLNAP
jgi:hypothetical protein